MHSTASCTYMNDVQRHSVKGKFLISIYTNYVCSYTRRSEDRQSSSLYSSVQSSMTIMHVSLCKVIIIDMRYCEKYSEDELLRG